MKKIGILAMIVGILSTLISTFFTVMHQRYDSLTIILFWGLLSAFELFSAWIWLFPEIYKIQHLQKMILAILIILTFAWSVTVSVNSDNVLIFKWAFKTLNYGGIYFVGLIIYYREKMISGRS